MGILKNYKFSKYNHKIKLKNDELFLYNTLTGGFCKIEKEAVKKIISCSDMISDVSSLEHLPENIISELKKGGFIIDRNLDELKLIKSISTINRFNVHNNLTLTLMPTTACNFRCPYCYEKENEYKNQSMSKELMDAIIHHIDKNLTNGGHLTLTWYGGEPLLRFDIVKDLQLRINKLAEEKEFTVHAGMITNGYFLTQDVSYELDSLGIRNIQVTIDGTKEVHDKTRILSNGKGSFDKIMDNLLHINKNISISIRININKDNIQNAPELINTFIKNGLSKNPNISPYFAVVKDYDTEKGYFDNSCYKIPEFSKEEISLNKLLLDNGFHSNKLTPRLSSCGAVSPRTLVIEPDGTMHKCWHVVGNKECSVGNLIDRNKDINLVIKNESEWYSWSPFDREECRNCEVLPICMGGCPYFSVYENDLYEKVKYRCDSHKFNLKDLLESIAYNHINISVAK